MTATQSPVAIITGGATGIGFGIAEALVQAGYRVAIGSRRKDVVDEAASRLQSLKKGQVIGLPLDVTDRTSVAEFVQAVGKHYGEIDILVNGAGVNIKNRTIGEMRPEQWDQVVAINATGAYNMIHDKRSWRRRCTRHEYLSRRSRHADSRATTRTGIPRATRLDPPSKRCRSSRTLDRIIARPSTHPRIGHQTSASRVRLIPASHRYLPPCRKSES